MTRLRFTVQLVAVLAFVALGATFAQGQASRTWVSGVGDDINPCSRTAPCKTFAGAISKTAINGEIDAMDPGGFGGLTITKSLTVDGNGTLAGILASGLSAAITVNFNQDDIHDPLKTARIRNLTLNGGGLFTCPDATVSCGGRTGTRGINVSSSSLGQPKVTIENTVIFSFVNEGILFAANGGDLNVNNSISRDNGTAGIRVDSFGNNKVFVSVDYSQTIFNAQEGIRFEDNVRGAITNSTLSNNTLNGASVVASTQASEMNIDLSRVSNNRQFGVVTSGGLSTIRLSGTEVTNNVTNGISDATGSVCSNTRNHITAPTMAPNCAFTDQ
ncbi:MAG TPA: right-handed parallel beta-helix repeat-containing protein [Pyrinomonadaceae bacterium]